MGKMGLVDRRDAVRMIVVEVEVQAFTHGIETVKQMEAVEVCEMRVGAITPAFGSTHGL